MSIKDNPQRQRGSDYKSYGSEVFLEVFDWSPAYPDSAPAASQDIVMFGNGRVLSLYKGLNDKSASGKGGSIGISDITNLLKSAIKSNGESSTNYGIQHIEFTRSKDRIDNQCIIRITGPVHYSIRGGNWCILWNAYIDAQGKTTVIPRFIGQIYSVNTSYQVLANGCVVSSTVVQIREWSSILAAPLMFDLSSTGQSLTPEASGLTLSKGVIDQASSVAKSVLRRALSETKGGGDSSNWNILEKIAGSVFNPYQFGAIILWVLGGLPKTISHIAQPITNDKLPPVWDFAITMPSVPKTMLDRLGLSEADPDYPFQTGFLEFVVGRQSGSMLNDGKWDGIFKTGTIRKFSKLHKTYENNTKYQPACSHVGVLAQIKGQSAWNIIYNNCDPQLNDIFTDIIYEYSSNENIIARPVFYLRGRPFRMKETENRFGVPENIKGSINTWTELKDLPRVRIDSSDIVGITFHNDILSTPTYIRPEFRSGSTMLDQSLTNQLGVLQAQRLNHIMKRYGGNNFQISSSFFGTEDILGWNLTKVWLAVSWLGDNHKFYSGAIAIKDCQTPIMVGMNIQFNLAGIEFVAHVESIRSVYSVMADGTKTYQTSINFSRLCMVDKDNDLTFLPPGLAQNLWQFDSLSVTGDKLIKSFGNSLDQIKNKISKFTNMIS